MSVYFLTFRLLILGSNDEVCDEYAAWTTLCEDLSGRPFVMKWQSKYCNVEESVKGSFKCLGISVLEATSWKGHQHASVGGVRMWEKV